MVLAVVSQLGVAGKRLVNLDRVAIASSQFVQDLLAITPSRPAWVPPCWIKVM
jgi:hypothetical protein